MAFKGHLHRHSEFSPLDGSGNANQYAAEAARKGQTHMALTDHGRLGGALEHVEACCQPEKFDDPFDVSKKRSKEERITPILGMEAYWRADRFAVTDHNKANHLVLHASSLRGWRTLMRLSSKAWVKRDHGGGHYGKPCIDWNMIEEDHEDIIVSTACISSPIAEYLLKGDYDGAKKWLRTMRNIVGDKLFLEVMPHDLDMQRTVNKGILNLSAELDIPFIGTGDVHVPYIEWSDTHLVLMMAATMQSVKIREKKKEAGEDVYGDDIDTIYMSSEKELRNMFLKHHGYMGKSVIQESLDNTELLTSKIKPYVIGKTTKLPQVFTKKGEAERVIDLWCRKGLRRIGKANDKQYLDRYKYEFGILRDKGVLDYFALVGDLVRWAKSTEPLPDGYPINDPAGVSEKERRKLNKAKDPIRVGLGRGSAAGSLVSYLIGITNIDPISWGLLFERFLNPDRVGLPDIDLDFQSNRRWETKEYLKQKYGHDHVADIIAYQTFAPRVVIKNIGQTQDISGKIISNITDSLNDLDRDLEKLVKANPVLKDFSEKYPFVWEQCLRLEGQILRKSKHASGLLVTPKPISFYAPTELGTDDNSTVTAWSDRADFPVVSDYGLVKLDILGTNGLEKQQLCVEMIREHYGVDHEPNKHPSLIDPYYYDEAVFKSFTAGHNLGVFQFSGRGITELLRHIRADNAIDIAAANALYRPGAMKNAFLYGDRKNGGIPESEWYWDEGVEPFLKETKGLLVFQEQIMEIVKVIGGFTGGEADAVRKIMGKLYRLPGDKARQIMEGWHSKWLEGSLKYGLTESIAQLIWDQIIEFSSYSFNKSHSASYGLQAVQDMEIKIKFPLAFYAATLTIEEKAKKEDQQNFLRGAMREAAFFDVKIKPPDVNISDEGWTIDKNSIRYGLNSVVGVGYSSAKKVIENRPFVDYKDFSKRMPTNFSVKASVSLAKAGGFNSIDDQKRLLSLVRKWPETMERYEVTMSCKCKKTRTLKVDPYTEEAMASALKQMLEEIECPRHPDATVENCEQESSLATFIEVGNLKKVLPRKRHIISKPTEDELTQFEYESLNLSLRQASIMARYKEFMEERIFTEEEFQEAPIKSSVVVGGEIINIKIITDKNKNLMAFVDLVFGVDHYNCTVFSRQYKKYEDLLVPNTTVMVSGKKDKKSVLVDTIGTVESIAADVGWKPPLNRKIKLRKKVAA